MKQQDYTIIFVIFLYIFVLRRFHFDTSDGGDITTLLLCFFWCFAVLSEFIEIKIIKTIRIRINNKKRTPYGVLFMC